MARLPIRLACGEYALIAPLRQQRVLAQGVALTVTPLRSADLGWQAVRDGEVEASECSLATYLLARCGGEPVVAIPVFPLRRFLHGNLLCRSEISASQALAGRRVGFRSVQNTVVLWVRGILREHYGVALEQVRWCTLGEEAFPASLPTALPLERLPAHQTLPALLTSGALDAAIVPDTMLEACSQPPVRRLFPDHRTQEQAYFLRTGIFPLIHTVVLHEKLVEQHPWVARSLLMAFRDAKALAYRLLENPRRLALAWVRDLLEEQRTVLGPDPWAYSLPECRLALETLIRYAREQGLLPGPLAIEALFPATTVDELPHY